MSLKIDGNTKVIVQGITGKEGGFHALRCLEYGTNVVACVTPGRGGQIFNDSIYKFKPGALYELDFNPLNQSIINNPLPLESKNTAN